MSKPIIVVKSGRAAQGAKAATSHTGALAGEDDVYQAAFDRVGIVRVDEISDLFDCAEVLAAQPMLEGNRLTIITNAGGPGVMATDSLTKAGGELAELSKQTKEKLDEVLPTWWSGSNPIDILGDARADRYAQALDICLSSKDSNAVLVILTPQAMTEPEKTAEAVIEKQKRYNKPVLTSWMGAGLVEKARDILQSARIPCYETPEMATYAFMNMFRYKRNIELLYQTPEHIVEEHEISVEDIHEKLRKIYESGRMLLSERESKEILEDYNIETTMPRLAEDDSQAVKIAEDTGFPAVMKIESEDITHKSDAGCVALNVKDKDEVKRKFNEIVQNAKRHKADVRVDGVTVQEMISKPFHELIIGAKKDPLFGSVILFGSGGITVELIKDKVIGFPPLNQTLAQRLMEKTKIYKLISEGWRNISPADLQVVQRTLVRFAQIMVDLPEIREVDINPLMAADKECLALDARIILDEEYFQGRIKPGRHLALSPYPTEYVKKFKFRDVDITFRPIRPEDEPLWVDMFKSFSQETSRQRFFHAIKEMPHSERIRYTFTDFNREIAIVPEIKENGDRILLGVARMTAQVDQETAEFAIVLRDKWQSIGLGEKLFDFIMDIARQKRWKVMVADVLPDNTKMINLFKKKDCCLDYNARDDLYNVVYRLS